MSGRSSTRVFELARSLSSRSPLCRLTASSVRRRRQCEARAREPLKVAAAADLSFAFKDVGDAFEKKTGKKVVFSFGATGLLEKQIAEGAPFDVFAAANVSFVDDAVQAGACLGGLEGHLRDGAHRALLDEGRAASTRRRHGRPRGRARREDRDREPRARAVRQGGQAGDASAPACGTTVQPKVGLRRERAADAPVRAVGERGRRDRGALAGDRDARRVGADPDGPARADRSGARRLQPRQGGRRGRASSSRTSQSTEGHAIMRSTGSSCPANPCAEARAEPKPA